MLRETYGIQVADRAVDGTWTGRFQKKPKKRPPANGPRGKAIQPEHGNVWPGPNAESSPNCPGKFGGLVR